MTRTPFPQQRIAEIVEEGMAMLRQGEERLAVERAAGLRCSCCNTKMAAPTPSGECADCAVL